MSNINKILGEFGEFGRKPRVNSKKKGASFERKIANLLNERFNTKEFCRTPGSGAFGTTHQLPQHLIVHGDLITPQNFRYTIECKNGYNLEIADLLSSKNELNKFIEQAKVSAVKSSRKWMVIYKKNHSKELVIVESKIPHLRNYICISDNCYVYQLKDVVSLPDEFWFL